MKIKICGLTQKKEAEYLNQAHVDFAGFVLFYPKSKRNNTIFQAQEIMQALSPDIKRVAVVVSPSREQITEIEQAGFDYIQIHGNLPQEILSHISLPVLRAFNVTDMEEYPSYHNSPQIAGYVFDAVEPGSGTTFDWNLVKQIPRDEKFLFLAGGLHPDNVSQAIQTLHPDGVDVSSGVEYDHTQGKDPNKIKHFVSAVKHTSS